MSPGSRPPPDPRLQPLRGGLGPRRSVALFRLRSTACPEILQQPAHRTPPRAKWSRSEWPGVGTGARRTQETGVIDGGIRSSTHDPAAPETDQFSSPTLAEPS